ncbi:ATP-binding cassette domain-containing protein [Candidatus Darwinibacter acetoxidans]
MVRVESLEKTYPGRRGAPPVKAVDRVSFQVPQGQLVGLLGPNGAGKTTIVKMMCGLIRPDAGQIFINGKDMVCRRTEALVDVSAVLEGNRNIYWRLTCRRIWSSLRPSRIAALGKFSPRSPVTWIFSS